MEIDLNLRRQRAEAGLGDSHGSHGSSDSRPLTKKTRGPPIHVSAKMEALKSATSRMAEEDAALRHTPHSSWGGSPRLSPLTLDLEDQGVGGGGGHSA